MRSSRIYLVSILFSILISVSYAGGASFDENNTNSIGFELLDNNTVAHIWNPDDDYFFNATSGIQFTNHYEEYWTHNIFCAGYKDPTEGWKYDCNDALPFTWSWDTDNTTYVNITGYRDKTISGRTIRFAIRYHLGLNDTKLSIILNEENIGSLDVPYDTGFAWRVNDIKISNDVENDQILTNSTYFWLNESLDLEFTNMDRGEYKLVDFARPNYAILQWNNNLTYRLDVMNQSGQYNAPVTLGINAGPLSVGQSKQTTMYWKDAINYLIPIYDINYTGWATTDPGSDTYFTEIDESIFSPDINDYISTTADSAEYRMGLSNCPVNYGYTTNITIIINAKPRFGAGDGLKKLYRYDVDWTVDDGTNYFGHIFFMVFNSSGQQLIYFWENETFDEMECNNLQFRIRCSVVNGTQTNEQFIYTVNAKVDNSTVQFNKTANSNFTFNGNKTPILTAKEYYNINLTTDTTKITNGTFPNSFSNIISTIMNRTNIGYMFYSTYDNISFYDLLKIYLFSPVDFNETIQVFNIKDTFLKGYEYLITEINLFDEVNTFGYFINEFADNIKIYSNRITGLFAPIENTASILIKRVTDIPYLFAKVSPTLILNMSPPSPAQLIYIGIERFAASLNFIYTGYKYVFYPSSAIEYECFGYCPEYPGGGGSQQIGRNEFNIEVKTVDIGYSMDYVPIEITIANKEDYKNYNFSIDMILLDENNTLYSYKVVNGIMEENIIQMHENLYLPLSTTGKELELVVRGRSLNYITEWQSLLRIVMINVFIIVGAMSSMLITTAYFKMDSKSEINRLKSVYRKYILKIRRKR